MNLYDIRIFLHNFTFYMNIKIDLGTWSSKFWYRKGHSKLGHPAVKMLLVFIMKAPIYLILLKNDGTFYCFPMSCGYLFFKSGWFKRGVYVYAFRKKIDRNSKKIIILLFFILVSVLILGNLS